MSWNDSDGTEEISSDSEVPSSFSNPIHGKSPLLGSIVYTKLG